MTRKAKKICIVAGARPNFMKIAPIIRALDKVPELFEWELVHTGQHYDHEMSAVFFDELGIPPPTFHLECGGGSHAEQTARIMVKFEEICINSKPDYVMVVGDVNSTLACSIVAKKLTLKVIHVEAGLRSRDMNMPEEVNRIVTDSIADYFFVTEPSGVENLVREGHDNERIYFVGHVMIDNLYYQLERLPAVTHTSSEIINLKSKLGRYGVVTLHRPSNVDDASTLQRIAVALNEISSEIPLVFPTHPRTALNLKQFNIELSSNVVRTGPLAYMEFLDLWKDAKIVLTDSGGVQEETTALGVPCITLRDTTERPVTVTEGTNVLVGTDKDKIIAAAQEYLAQTAGDVKPRPQLWDGRAAERIVAAMSLWE